MATGARQRRCNRNCGRSQTQELGFIGIDGEGETVDGVHRYILFSIGDQSIHNPHGLTHDEVFQFLWDAYLENPKAAYVGFFLGYDFTQWLRSLSESRARALLSVDGIAKRQRRGANPAPFPVDVDGRWEIDLLMGKRFKLRAVGGAGWLYVCDAGPFYQSSFLTAIDPSKRTSPVCSPREYETIREGKEQRADARYGPDMMRYNVTENVVLARLMDELNRGLIDGCEIRLKRNQWFGPGQAAQAWLASVNAPTAKEMNANIPDVVLRAAQATYFGGWFEIFAHGHVPGESYEYDINSAYPSIIADLPCLIHGEWVEGSGRIPSDERLSMLYGTVTSVDRKVGALLHREDHSRICRPMRTRGWFWAHEIKAALRLGARFVGVVSLEYRPCPCPKPFAKIRHLYLKRLAVGKNTPAGKALKLVYNSVYGKMAQSVGSPKYASPIYASLVTSGCRTQILHAIASHPTGSRDLLMVATDGVYFASPHPSLDVSAEELGKWDATTKVNLTLMKPGVYWDDKSRDYIRRDLPPLLKSRGVSARNLARIVPRLDDMWADWRPGHEWPSIRIPIDFAMVSAKSAIHRGRWDTCGKVTQFEETSLFDGDPSIKRDARRVAMVDGRWESSVRRDTKRDSLPYQRTFGVQLDDLYVTPDYDMVGSIRQLIGAQ